jgi:hypothetical protein
MHASRPLELLRGVLMKLILNVRLGCLLLMARCWGRDLFLQFRFCHQPENMLDGRTGSTGALPHPDASLVAHC